jgi:predicted GNAT family acetyltransferase
MSTQPDVVVTDDPDQHRYVATVDGERVGYAVYHATQGRHLFVHTEVDDDHEGEGVGSALIRGALDDVRDKGGSVVALCPFVQTWIGKHDDEYGSLVDEELDTLLRP